MNRLKPIRDFNSYSSPIAKAIFAMWDEMIYAPLTDIIKGTEKTNSSQTQLESSLIHGVMEYRDGYFVGPIKASIAKELRGYGAIFNHTRKVYYLEMSRLPQNILQAIALGKQSGQAVVDKVNKLLITMEGVDVKAPNIAPFFDETLHKLGKQFVSTTRTVSSSDLEIPINPKFEEELKEAYTLNLDKYIKGWYDEAILRLRQKVSENVHEGYRASNLIDIIRSERGISQRKATFLARQETSLLTSSYREIRYKDIGVNQYIWSTSHDERVRPDHRLLNGKKFDFDHPPITDQATGARNNPGEDFNCRCVAIPYLSNGVNFIENNQQLMESTK